MSCYCIQLKNATESMLLQELAFANGYKWPMPEHTEYRNYESWLFFDNVDKMISWSPEHYKHEELTIEDMIRFIKGECNPVKTFYVAGQHIKIRPNKSISIGNLTISDKDIQSIMTIYSQF